MTTLEVGFQAALRENPADKVTRLIYADWLEEQGRGQDAYDQRRRIELMDPLRYEPQVPATSYNVLGPVFNNSAISGNRKWAEKQLAYEARLCREWANRGAEEPAEELCSI